MKENFNPRVPKNKTKSENLKQTFCLMLSVKSFSPEMRNEKDSCFYSPHDDNHSSCNFLR